MMMMLMTSMMTMITYALADDLAELCLVDSAVDLKQQEQEGGPLVVAAAWLSFLNFFVSIYPLFVSITPYLFQLSPLKGVG